jgi:GH18 family chitinase
VKAKAKARYLDSFSLGGVMLRELSGDRRGELIDVLNAELR